MIFGGARVGAVLLLLNVSPTMNRQMCRDSIRVKRSTYTALRSHPGRTHRRTVGAPIRTLTDHLLRPLVRRHSVSCSPHLTRSRTSRSPPHDTVVHLLTTAAPPLRRPSHTHPFLDAGVTPLSTTSATWFESMWHSHYLQHAVGRAPASHCLPQITTSRAGS